MALKVLLIFLLLSPVILERALIILYPVGSLIDLLDQKLIDFRSNVLFDFEHGIFNGWNKLVFRLGQIHIFDGLPCFLNQRKIWLH